MRLTHGGGGDFSPGKGFEGNLTSKTKSYAFTLAEVLITLAVIGVVAALTMPTLIQKYQEKATIAKLRKVNTTLNQAYQLAQIEYGSVNSWFTKVSINNDTSGVNLENQKLFYEKIAKYMKTTSVCYDDEEGCPKYNTVFTLSGTKRDVSWRKNVQLADGTFIMTFWVSRINCNANSNCGDFAVDINGDKGPNTMGKDVFNFIVSQTAIYPNGAPALADAVEVKFPKHCDRKTDADFRNGYTCAAWVVYNENMDYLHCDGLSWNGKHKCD